MRARLFSVLALGLLVPLGGCLDYDEQLAIEPDGSGHVAIDLTIDLSCMAELRKLDPMPESEDAGDIKSLVSKEALLKDCDLKGITVKTCEVEDKPGKKTHVKLAFDFKDLDSLRAVRFFSDRDLEVVEAGDNVELVYKYNAKSLFSLNGYDPDAKPTDEREKKAKQILDDARKASSCKFALKLPGALVATTGDKPDEKTARFVVDKTTPKAQEALCKEPLTMKATLAKKDVPFWAKEVERAKERKKRAETPASPLPKTPPKGDLGTGGE